MPTQDHLLSHSQKGEGVWNRCGVSTVWVPCHSLLPRYPKSSIQKAWDTQLRWPTPLLREVLRPPPTRRVLVEIHVYMDLQFSNTLLTS